MLITTTLGPYDNSLFETKIVSLLVDEGDLNNVCLWWQSIPEKRDWITSFKNAMENLPSSTPEKADARKVFKGCEERFDAINLKLMELLSRKVSSQNLIVRFWIDPVRDAFKAKPEVQVFDDLVELIKDWKREFWTREMDQILSVIEAIGPDRDNKALKQVRLIVAQQSFEEFIGSIPRQKLHHLYKDMPDQEMLDDLEIERVELAEALDRGPWRSEIREKYRRLYHSIRKSMDDLNCETEVKTGFNRMFDYATGHIGRSVSASDIQKNVESAWDGFKNDDTLHDFWEFELEQLEEA